MSIREIDQTELFKVRQIAEITWPIAFGEILSKEQLDYMLNWMYSMETLSQQLLAGHTFFLYEEDGEALGFMGTELNYQSKSVLKIHKLYILPNQQGKGIGKALIDRAKKQAKEHAIQLLTLNVNRYNKALYFYEKLGFNNVKSEDIEIGKGYLMEDYVLELKID